MRIPVTSILLLLIFLVGCSGDVDAPLQPAEIDKDSLNEIKQELEGITSDSEKTI